MMNQDTNIDWLYLVSDRILNKINFDLKVHMRNQKVIFLK